MKAATGEVVSAEDLGGGDVHTRISGVADHFAENDAHALLHRARIVGNLNRRKLVHLNRRTGDRARLRPAGTLRHHPTDTRKPYDVREVIARIVDGSAFRRIQGALRRYAGDGLRPSLRLSGRHRRQQRHPVRRERAKGAHFFIELCASAASR